MNVYLPNLTFDDHIMSPQSGVGSGAQQVIDSLAPLMGLFAGADDVVLIRDSRLPDSVPDCLSDVRWSPVSDISQLPKSARLVPWGWDAHARELAVKLKMQSPVPTEASVKAVNHRSFQAEFDRLDAGTHRLPLGEQFGRLCHELDQVREALNAIGRSDSALWIIKAAYSASGRNRLHGTGETLSDSNCRWVQSQLEIGGSVYVEPVYNVIWECGIQFHLEPTAGCQADYQLCGVTGLLTDRSGRYRGSLIAMNPSEEWLQAVPRAEIIAAAAGNLGYFGPLGIDCMRIQLQDGSQVLRVGHDINGRHTMGRLALELLPLPEPGHAGCWIHGLASDPADRAGTCLKFPAVAERHVVESVQTSPQAVGGVPPVVQTQLLVTSSLKDAQIVAKSILA